MKNLDLKKSVVLLSGGMDSTTLLYYLLKEEGKNRDDVTALSVNYGQRHSIELESAAEIAMALGVEYRLADLRSVSFCLLGGSQTDLIIPVPKGHYTDPSMKLTVVPNRNMILLSLGVGLAISTGCAEVAYAAHAGDHAIYPDCRSEFIEAFEKAAALAWYEPVKLRAPFQTLTKADIVRIGSGYGVPWDKTWSCYEGGEIHCGRCGTDVERKLAFKQAGVLDPTEYEDPIFGMEYVK